MNAIKNVCLLSLLFVFTYSAPGFAQEPDDVSIPQDEFQIPGTIEATGTHFELTDSDYLNITLDSSEPIKLMLESVPEMVTMHIESASGANLTEITLGGFAPNTTYHKYEDDYHNHAAFTTDANGNYSYTQDLSELHLVFIQTRTSTIFLSNSGWSEPGVGTWDPINKTATLTQEDLTQTIQIDDDGITLDGNWKTINGDHSSHGVYLYNRTGVTIKNLNVTNFWSGIRLISSNNNDLTDNTANSTSYYGIYLESSNNNNLTGNTASNSINSNGIYLYYSSNNTLTGNTANSNKHKGIYLRSSGNNTLSNNAMFENTYNFDVYGDYASDFVQTIDITNTVDWKPIYYLVGVSGEVIDASKGAGYVGVVNSTNVTVRNLTLEKNWYGVLFAYTSYSSIENVNVSNNYYGIYLISSSNNDLMGNTASNNEQGISLRYSSNNNLTGNTVNSNIWGGITLGNSGNNTLSYNAMSENTYNFYVYGKYASGYVQTIDITNTVDGRPIYYLVGVSDVVIDGDVTDAGYVGVVNCQRVTVKNLTLTKNYQGVLFAHTSYSSIENVTVSNNWQQGIFLTYSSNNNITGNTANSNKSHGISLAWSSYNNLTGNTVSNNPYGILLSNYSSYNNLTGNTASNRSFGIYLTWHSSSNNITGNTVSDNQRGIYLNYSKNNKLTGNTLSNNGVGIDLLNNCDNNQIYNNNFIDNSYQVNGSGSGNIFNLDWPIGGNYWSNWTSPDLDGDGFVDDPYVFTGGQDNLPWTLQDGWPINQTPVADAGSDLTVLVNDNVTFDGSGSSDPDGEIANFEWEFGDGDTGSGSDVFHIYTASGTYTVILTVTDDYGAQATDEAIVTVQTAEEAIDDVISEIGEIELPDGTANSFISKLENAVSSVDKDNIEATIGKLNAFINQVEGLIGNKLTSEDGQMLIDAANALINYLSGLTKEGNTGHAGIAAQPKSFLLEHNYPNPFNPTTTIQFQLPNSSFVTLKIYNVTGTLVKTLVSENISAGVHSFVWNGKNESGQQVSSGMYIYHLQAGEFSAVKKMLFIK